MFKKIFIAAVIVFFLAANPLLAANVWTDNPYVVDATEDSSYSGMIQSIEWHPSAADDDCYIRDGGGGLLFKCRAPIAATNSEAEGIIERIFNPPRPANNIDVETIDGGTVYIHLYKTRN
jgi:hypothetical protein